MTRGRRSVLLAVLALALAPAPPVEARTPVRSTTLHVEVRGNVEIQFAGGGNSGSVTWDPGREGDLSVSEYRTPSGRRFEASLVLFGELGENGPTTTAHVRRAGDGVCSDARSDPLVFLDFAPAASDVVLRPLGGPPDETDAIRTRCGGPVRADVAAALPSLSLEGAALARGGRTIDLSGTGRFESGGFRGTAGSTLKLRLERGRGGPALPAIPFTAEGRRTIRTVTAVYRVERVSGEVVTGFGGGLDGDLCDLLGACGATGSVRISPSVSSGRATLSASAPARRVSGRGLRAALGLVPGARPRGVTASGLASWTGDAGSAAETLTRADGTTCADSLPLGGGSVSFRVGARRVFASYGEAPAAGADPLRTRCPGPSLVDAAATHPLATGSVSRRTFAKRRVRIALSAGRRFEAAPYSGETRPALEIVLRRVRVRARLEADSLPLIGGLVS